ncbi:hypothetical protein ACIQU5_16290 [Streptomyces sp. NPDC090306]|uniref:hypothetical protein n=1 Tax=unclassified Streptomyces TaxID=2593676 RepID=UPI0036EFAF3F
MAAATGRQLSSQHPTARRALVALATAGVALGAGAGAASASTDGGPAIDAVRTRPTSLGNVDPLAGLDALGGTLGYVTGPLSDIQPNPLAGTGVDPLDNGVGAQLADFKPLTSQALTAPVAEAKSIGSMPVIGGVTRLLQG